VSIVGSFFFLKGAAIVWTIVISLGVLVAIFFLKVKLINIYLKQCKYPNEFLSVLGHLKLMDDIEINWSIEGASNSNYLTNQFLEDNNLATEIGKKKASIPVAITMIFISLGLLGYVSQTDWNGKSLLMGLIIVTTIFWFYMLAKGQRQKNDHEPILIFSKKGFLLNEMNIKWDKIKTWEYKAGNSESKGFMIIYYQNLNNVDEELKVQLDDLNIDRIDFLLLMTHFKTKYGS